jgi:DNA-binding protein HU-beta
MNYDKKDGEKMNKRQLVSRIAEVMRLNNVRKQVLVPKKVFHISDDDGNHKDFVVKSADKNVLFSVDDVENVIDAAIQVIEESLKVGEPVTVQGFGTLGLKYRKARATKQVGTDEWIDIAARYVPKFSFGNDLRMAAKLYELSLSDLKLDEPLPIFSDENGDE